MLVRHEGNNRFIGACKFWSGVKGFLASIEQLFGYTAWRDTKLAVVMFVRERALTDIIEKAREAIADTSASSSGATARRDRAARGHELAG